MSYKWFCESAYWLAPTSYKKENVCAWVFLPTSEKLSDSAAATAVL